MRRFALVAALVSLIVASCADAKKDAAQPSTSTTTPSTLAPRTTTTEGPLIDDEPAADALLADAQLPPGKWSAPAASATVWSISAQDLLAVPECAHVGLRGRARTEKRTGHAFDTWVGADGVQLHEESELFPSPRRVDAVIAALKSSAGGDCVEAALRKQSQDRGAEITGIKTRGFDVGLRPAELRLGFVGGADVSMTESRNGVPTAVALRVVCLGFGGGFVCMTLTADNARRFDDLDLAPTVRTAAKDFLATFGM
jgi:hypothetical protein